MSSCTGATTSGGSTPASTESVGRPRAWARTPTGQTVASQQVNQAAEANKQQHLYDDLYRQLGDKIGNSYEDVLFWMSD